MADKHPAIKKEVIIGDCRLILGDCLEVMPLLGEFDALVTDPPYPDWLTEKYKYFDGIIDVFNTLDCRQLVFWSTKCDFPLDYTARHVWDKKTGCGSEYEFIFERNGNKNFKVIRHYLINSSVAASFTGDVWTGHKSQKPYKLMIDCIKMLDEPQSILDPFMGSGTTGVACVKLGRKFTGIELDPEYFEIACERIRKAYEQPDMFVAPPSKPLEPIQIDILQAEADNAA